MEILVFAAMFYLLAYGTERAKAEWRHQRHQHARQLRRDHPNWSPRKVERHAKWRNRAWWWHEAGEGFPSFRGGFREGREQVRYLREHEHISREERRSVWRTALDDIQLKRRAHEAAVQRGDTTAGFEEYYQQVSGGNTGPAARRAAGQASASQHQWARATHTPDRVHQARCSCGYRTAAHDTELGMLDELGGHGGHQATQQGGGQAAPPRGQARQGQGNGVGTAAGAGTGSGNRQQRRPGTGTGNDPGTGDGNRGTQEHTFGPSVSHSQTSAGGTATSGTGDTPPDARPDGSSPTAAPVDKEAAAAEAAAWHTPETGAGDGLSPPQPGEPGPAEGVIGYRTGTDDLGEYREPVHDDYHDQSIQDQQRHGDPGDPSHWGNLPHADMTPEQRAAYAAAEDDVARAGWGRLEDQPPSVRRNLLDSNLRTQTRAAGNGQAPQPHPAGASNGSNETSGGNGMPTGTHNGELAGDSPYLAAQAAFTNFDGSGERFAGAAETLEAQLTAHGFHRDPALMTHIRALREAASQINTHARNGSTTLVAHHSAGHEYHRTGVDANASAFRH